MSPTPRELVHHPEVDAFIAAGAAEPVVLGTGSNGAARPVSEPMPTITTGGAGTEGRPGCARPALIEPFVMSRHNEGAPRPVSEPTPTQVAKHSHMLFEPAMIAPYYGTGSGETCSSASDPLPTITTKERFGMVVPVTHSAGGNQARDIGNPLPTITTAKGGEFAIAEAADGYDILFRMLEPEELAAAMGFTDDDYSYEFTGTKTERVKQVGNAVSVRKMKACVRAIMADAAP